MPLVIKRRSGESVLINGLLVQVELYRGNRIKMLFFDPEDGRDPPVIHRQEVAEGIPALRAVHGLPDRGHHRPQPAEAACDVPRRGSVASWQSAD